MEKSNLPASDVNTSELLEWVESQKPLLKEIETDVRDAKRRICVAKGPRKKPAAEVEASEGTSGGESGD